MLNAKSSITTRMGRLFSALCQPCQLIPLNSSWSHSNTIYLWRSSTLKCCLNNKKKGMLVLTLKFTLCVNTLLHLHLFWLAPELNFYIRCAPKYILTIWAPGQLTRPQHLWGDCQSNTRPSTPPSFSRRSVTVPFPIARGRLASGMQGRSPARNERMGTHSHMTKQIGRERALRENRQTQTNNNLNNSFTFSHTWQELPSVLKSLICTVFWQTRSDACSFSKWTCMHLPR